MTDLSGRAREFVAWRDDAERQARGRLRLYHCRRWNGRLRPRQSPDGGSVDTLAPSGGRRIRPLPLGPHPGRLWQLGNVGWAWGDVLPYFIKSEDHHAGASDLHGSGGEWKVSRQRVHWDILKAVQEGAKEFSIMRRADFNDGSNEGTGFFEVNQKNGVRWSTARGFLRPALRRRNLRLLTHAETEKIMVEGGRVTGVRFRLNHRSVEARARCEVILAAGAINTPKILEMSGIGDPELLQKLGIKTVLDRPAVGENLQDHLQIRTVFKVSGAKTLNTLANSKWGKARIGLQYLVTQSGPMSMAPSQFGMFTKFDPSLTMPNLEYHVQPLSTNRLGEPLHPFPAITMSVCNLRPDSVGSCHVTNLDHTVQPDIRPSYEPSLSVTIVEGAKPYLFRRLRINRSAALGGRSAPA